MGFAYLKTYQSRRLRSHSAKAVVCRLHLSRGQNKAAIDKAMAHIPKRNFGLLGLSEVLFQRFIDQKMAAHGLRRGLRQKSV